MARVMRLLAVLTFVAGAYAWSQDWLYMAMNILVLWFPTFLLFGYAFPRLSNWYRVSFYTILLVMCNLCAIIEYIALQYDWWNFSEAVDKLSPWKVGNIPLEEFAFWFGGSAEVMVLYLALSVWLKTMGMERGELGRYFDRHREKARLKKVAKNSLILPATLGWLWRLIRRVWRKLRIWKSAAPLDESPELGKAGFYTYARGLYFPGWTITVAAFVLASFLLIKSSYKKLNGWALVLCYLISNLMYLLVEYNGICRGHWVWNEQKIWGPKLGVIPLEEIGLYISASAFSSPLMEICHDFLIRVHATNEDKAEREKNRGYRAFVSVGEIEAEIRDALGKEREP